MHGGLSMLMVFGVSPYKQVYPKPYCRSRPKKVLYPGKVLALGWGLALSKILSTDYQPPL